MRGTRLFPHILFEPDERKIHHHPYMMLDTVITWILLVLLWKINVAEREAQDEWRRNKEAALRCSKL